MKQLCKAALLFISIAALAALFAASGAAAPALGEERVFTQPGGGTFLGTPAGDEQFHYVKAGDGAVLTRGEDGLWYYAGTDDRYLLDTPAAAIGEDAWVRQQMAAVLPAPENGAPQLRLAAPDLSAMAVTGNQNLLVLLVDFRDVKIQYEAQWANLVFGEEGSVKRYYSDATGGAIAFVPARESYVGAGAAGDGVVRVALDRDHPNDKSVAVTRDAIRAAANLVDFASYDRNSDRRLTSDETISR